MVSEVVGWIWATWIASIPLQPPAKFNFSNPDKWLKWRRRFEHFRIASGMGGESKERQISNLLFCLSKEAEDILMANRGRYVQVLGKMDEFFKARKNVILSEQGSTGEHSAWERLTKSSSFASTAWQPITSAGPLKWDDPRLSGHGNLNTSLCECLQMVADLTLEKVKQVVRQREAVQKQQTILHCREQLFDIMESYLKRDKRSSSWRSRTRHRGSSSSTARSVSGVARAHTCVAPGLSQYHWEWKPCILEGHNESQRPDDDLQVRHRTCIHNAFVVRDLEQNLLVLPAIQDLNLLAKVAEVRQGPDDLGDVTAQFLSKKVQEELAHMESLGDITKVNLPTPLVC